MTPILIRVPDDKYELYKELAREEGLSLAGFFRDAADKKIVANRPKKKYSIFDLGTTVIFKGGPKDGSVNHDKYLYEFEERKIRDYYRKRFG